MGESWIKVSSRGMTGEWSVGGKVLHRRQMSDSELNNYDKCQF